MLSTLTLKVMGLETRFCLDCKNFEDRKEIEGVVICAKGHSPGVNCPEFQDRFEGLRRTASKTRFCLECINFEDRMEIDGTVLCAKGHRPGVNCPEFQDRLVDSFYSYIYWASLYSSGETDEGRDYFEKHFSRKLSRQELAYACLLDYFELGLEDSYFYRSWKTIRRIYERKLPAISKIFDIALERFDLHDEKTDFTRVFLDLLSSEKTSEEAIEEASEGLYKWR